MATRDIKESVIALVRDMPADVTLDDIIEALYVRQKILRGLQDAKEGRSYTHEEAREILEQRLQ